MLNRRRVLLGGLKKKTALKLLVSFCYFQLDHFKCISNTKQFDLQIIGDGYGHFGLLVN